MKRITIPMVATAAVKFEMVPYTGTRGLYSSVIPQNTDLIVALAEELGIKLDSNAVHITVCYSKEDAIPLENLPPYGSSTEFYAMCNEVAHWKGHKGQTCIVLKLISPDIVKANAALQSVGAVHTFTPYSPHISLSDEVPVDDAMQSKIDAINKRLASFPLHIVCDRYQVGDQDN